jgi:DNA polymerase III delta subunit
MFNAKVLLDKGLRTGEIAKRCNIWGQTDKLFAQIRKISLKKVAEYLKQLAQTDYLIKTGQTNAPVAMEQFVLQLSTR